MEREDQIQSTMYMSARVFDKERERGGGREREREREGGGGREREIERGGKREREMRARGLSAISRVLMEV